MPTSSSDTGQPTRWPVSQQVHGSGLAGKKLLPLGPRFVRVLTATALSNLADGVLAVALPLIAVTLTQSPLLISLLAFTNRLPWLLFSLPAGALADRLDRRAVMLLANSIRCVVGAALAVVFLLNWISIWWLYAAALVLGLAEVLYDTTAQSILPQVVPRPALPRANARIYAAEVSSNQFIGPPVGGLLVAAAAAWAVGAPALLWTLAVLVLWTVKGNFQAQQATGQQSSSLRRDIAEGMGFLFRHRLLRTLATMTGISNFASAMLSSILVIYLVGPYSHAGLSDGQFGLLMTTMAIGSLLGSVIAAPLVGRLGRQVALGIGIVTFAGPSFALAVGAHVWIVGGLMAVSGMGIMVWNVTTVSLRQQLTPDRLLGRINSCYRLLAWGVAPLGALAGGAMGSLLGLRAVFIASTVISLLAALGLRVASNQAISQAELAASAGESG